MSDRRFRFRLPWLSGASTRRKAEIQRPRPKVETQPPSQPRATKEPQITAPPASPSRATAQTRAASMPPSPSRTATDSQITPKPESPSQAVQISQPPSPLRPGTQVGSRPPLVSSELTLSASQQEEPKAAQVPQAKTAIVSETAAESQNQVEAASGPEPANALTSTPPLETPVPSQKLNSSIVVADQHMPPSKPEEQGKETEEGKKVVEEVDQPMPPSKPEKQGKETEEGKKVVEEIKKEGKISGPAYEEPSTITAFLPAASGSGTEAKELLSDKFEAPKRHQEEKEILKRKKTINISSGSEHTKTMGLTHPKAWNILTESHQKPLESNGETTDGEGSSKGRRHHPKDQRKEDLGTSAYINSNAQGINNSILFESSLTERDPGVQLVFSRKLAEPAKSSA